jgi:hypothetical protein
VLLFNERPYKRDGLSSDLVVFYFLSASVIWPDNRRVAFDGSSLIRGVLFIVVWYCQKPLVLCKKKNSLAGPP